MKTFSKIRLLSLTFATALPMLQAAALAPATTPATTDKAAHSAQHPRAPRALAQRRALRQRVAKQLNLSKDQIAQIKAARAKTAADVKAIRGDTSLTPEQKKAKVRAAVQAARTETRAVLTPDQQQKLDGLKQQLRRVRRLG